LRKVQGHVRGQPQPQQGLVNGLAERVRMGSAGCRPPATKESFLANCASGGLPGEQSPQFAARGTIFRDRARQKHAKLRVNLQDVPWAAGCGLGNRQGRGRSSPFPAPIFLPSPTLPIYLSSSLLAGSLKVIRTTAHHFFTH